MLYVKAINNIISAYPYTQTDLIRDNPSTSFPAGGVSPADLAEWNVFPVHFSEQPSIDPLAQKMIELPPVFDGSSWIQQWSVENLSQEEISAMTDAQASAIRNDRNQRLGACDWTQLADAPGDGAAWAAYRQELRDIPSQAGFPWNVIWPVEP